MIQFTSDRERRLWLWTAAVMAAIYSTLGIAQDIAVELRERNLLRISLAIAFAAIAVAVISTWVRRGPGPREAGVAIAVGFAYLWTLLRLQEDPNWAERTHLVEYGIVAAIIHLALKERKANERRPQHPAAWAFGASAALGWIDEGIQWLLPGRVYDWIDVGFNLIAVTVAVVGGLVLDWARRRDGR